MSKTTQRGICPKCGSDNIIYGDLDSIYTKWDDQIYYKFTCDNCNITGKEWYTISFIEMTEDK